MAVRTLDVWRDRAACRGPETALFFPPSTTERRDDREARERRAKAICTQCQVRRECLDHTLVLGEAHLRRVLREYSEYLNRARPHQGLGQRTPVVPEAGLALPAAGSRVLAIPVLGGLHHT